MTDVRTIEGTVPKVADHELVRQIGRGSYGHVWLARSMTGAWRAVKIVWADPDGTHAFDRELAGIRKFEPVSRSCPGLVHVLQVGKGKDYFYCIMELADDGCADEPWHPEQERAAGGMLNAETYIPRTLSLEKRRRGKLPAEECLRLGLRLTEALEHLHSHNLLHRDLKPSNIIFVKGEPKLADIGLVAELSEARSYVGTEGYIPPEGPNSAQADIYSAGKVLYEISTGKDRQDFPEPVTFTGEDRERRLLQELNSVILKACHPEPAARYKSAAEMLRELNIIQRGQSVRRHRSARRRIKVLTYSSAALIVIASGALVIEQRLNTRIVDIQGTSSRIPPRLAGKVPERPSGAPANLIDLSPHYNASLVEPWHPGPQENTLQMLRPGIVRLAETEFDVRGLVQLSGREISINGADAFPAHINGIHVAQWARRLHFLHGAISEMPEGAEIGRYAIRYVSGQTVEVPILYGTNVRPLWQPADTPGTVNNALLAWQGENPATRERGMQLRLYKLTWENPHPEQEIEAVDLLSAVRNSAPFLVALTADEAPPGDTGVVHRPDLTALLQQHADSFPEFPSGETLQKFQFSQPALEIDGRYFQALRLRTPRIAGQDLLWAISLPHGFPDGQWYIIPASGRMKSGFEDWWHLELPPDQKRVFRVQHLPGKKLRPDTEYLLWFGLKNPEVPEIELLLKFLPGGSASPHKPAELAKALGLGPEYEARPAHRHYCLGAMQ